MLCEGRDIVGDETSRCQVGQPWRWIERHHTLGVLLVHYAEPIEYLPFVSPGTFLSGLTTPAPSELHAIVGSSSGFQTKSRKELSISAPISAHKRSRLWGV